MSCCPDLSLTIPRWNKAAIGGLKVQAYEVHLHSLINSFRFVEPNDTKCIQMSCKPNLLWAQHQRHSLHVVYSKDRSCFPRFPPPNPSSSPARTWKPQVSLDKEIHQLHQIQIKDFPHLYFMGLGRDSSPSGEWLLELIWKSFSDYMQGPLSTHVCKVIPMNTCQYQSCKTTCWISWLCSWNQLDFLFYLCFYMFLDVSQFIQQGAIQARRWLTLPWHAIARQGESATKSPTSPRLSLTK